MSYLIDTNIISELRRKDANSGVVSWFADRPANTLYLSVLTLGEIRKGIEALPNSKRKLTLRDWLEVDCEWRSKREPDGGVIGSQSVRKVSSDEPDGYCRGFALPWAVGVA